MVPACARCNYSRGAKYGNSKPRAPRKPREPKTFFSGETSTPDTRLDSLSFDSDTPTGHDRPRLFAMQADCDGSFAGEVATFARTHLGMELMPWQMVALDAQLSHKAGRLAHRVSLVSVARQNGKTTAMKALLGWWLTSRAASHGKQTVLSVANKLILAERIFGELAPILIDKFGASAKWSSGRMSLTMPDGSSWLVIAANASAGHGYSPDLIVIDELFDISTETVDQGLMPGQRARPQPLLSMWSTAGTEASQAMIRWREQGIRAIEKPDTSMCFAEWSPPPGSSEEEPTTWGWANPALGHTLTAETLRIELESPNREAFLRAAMNTWVTSEQSWMPARLWNNYAKTSVETSGGYLAVESRTDESRYFAVRGVNVSGIVNISFGIELRSMDQLWEWIGQELDRTPRPKPLIAASLSHTMPSSIERHAILVGRKELATMTRNVRALIGEGKVIHDGHSHLTDHVTRAVGIETGSGFTLSALKSPGPIELARCFVWAAGFASRPERARSRPAMGFSPR